MDTWQCLFERRSIRNFERGKEIPEEILEKIMRSAWYALSVASAYQPAYFPWRFVINKIDQDIKDRLADSGQEVAMTIFGNVFEIFGPGHLWYMSPEVQLRVAEYTTTGELWRYPEDASVNFIPLIGKGWIDNIGCSVNVDYGTLIQYQGFAVMNMWLVGHKYGIGAGYNGMPLLDERRREILGERFGLPRSWDTCGCFSFGYPEHPRYYGPTRPGLEGFIFSEYWGVPYTTLAIRRKDYGKIELPETDIEDIIKNINYVQNFEEAPVPEWKMEKVMDAGIWGPMPEMLKNWRAILIKDQESKDFLQKVRSEKLGGQWNGVWAERMFGAARGSNEQRMDEVERILDYGMGNTLREADSLLLVCTTVFGWMDNPDIPGIAMNPQLMFNISTGCCIQNMMIAATALELGMDYDSTIPGDQRTRELIMDYFGIPNSWYPLGILALGSPGKKAVIKRPPPNTLFCDEYWGKFYPLTLEE